MTVKQASKEELEEFEIAAPMKCGGCGFTQTVNVIFLKNQKVRSVEWSCPRCGDGKKAIMSRHDDLALNEEKI